MDPAAPKLLAAEPPPTSPNPAVNNYISSPTNTTRANRVDVKEDTQLSQADSLFARYSYFGGNAVNYGPFPAPLVGSTSFQTAPHGQPWQRRNGERVPPGLQPPTGLPVAFCQRQHREPVRSRRHTFTAGRHGLPSISISGFTNLGEATFLPRQDLGTINAEDHVSWTLGKHLIRFGGDHRWVRSWFYISSNARGAYTFNGSFTQNPQSTAGTGSAMADFSWAFRAVRLFSNQISGVHPVQILGRLHSGRLESDAPAYPEPRFALRTWTQPVKRNNLQGNFLIGDGKLVFANNRSPAGVPASLVEPIPGGRGARSPIKTDTTRRQCIREQRDGEIAAAQPLARDAGADDSRRQQCRSEQLSNKRRASVMSNSRARSGLLAFSRAQRRS
jgi:hypothetical protein